MPTTASHAWRPSAARTIVLDTFVPVPRGTTPLIPPALSWPVKDPGDVLDYQFDIAPALIGNDGDTISTLDITISPANPGDLTLNSSTADGARAVLWLSNGQTGTVYTITLNIGTEAGRTIVRSVLLPVFSLATQADAINSVSQTEAPVTVVP